jgi:hypothetical protein
MVYFQTKNPNLGKFWKVLQWKMMVFLDHFVYFTAKWYILWSFGIFFPLWHVVPCHWADVLFFQLGGRHLAGDEVHLRRSAGTTDEARIQGSQFHQKPGE